jgi:hypothetical protein
MCAKFCFYALLVTLFFSCRTRQNDAKEEQISLDSAETYEVSDSTINSIKGNLSLNQIPSFPSNVILTGMPDHRLVTVYKQKPVVKKSEAYFSSYQEYEVYDDDRDRHYMPGIDLLYGYNLLNIAHYDIKKEQLNYLFDRPVLIKSLYYPSTVPDSIDKKPVNRDYYLVSAYDADTNRDTLLNRNDLRRFYYFNASASQKIQLIPSNYSVVRSEYDRANDVIYVFARHDANANGSADKREPLHIFWFSLKAPEAGKRLY